MTDLFTFAEAQRRRDRGIALAANAQNASNFGWSDRAYAALERIARQQSEVHVDHLLRAFTERPDRPNSYGSVWQKAIRKGLIEHTGRVRPCTVDPGKHAHQYPIYSSLIYGK